MNVISNEKTANRYCFKYNEFVCCKIHFLINIIRTIYFKGPLSNFIQGFLLTFKMFHEIYN